MQRTQLVLLQRKQFRRDSAELLGGRRWALKRAQRSQQRWEHSGANLNLR